MAIIKIGLYRRPPQDMEDFDGISELLMAYAREVHGQGMVLTEWTNSTNYPKLAMGTYIFHGGASYLVETEDYAISEPVNGTYYLRVAADGETLAVSWVSSLTGYAWNPIYNGLYHPDQSQILPYQLIVDGSMIEKWRITNLAQKDGYIIANWQGLIRSLNAKSLNTGQGDNFLYPMDQGVKSIDTVLFERIKSKISPTQIVFDESLENIFPDRIIINAKAGDIPIIQSIEQSCQSVANTSWHKVKEITNNIADGILRIKYRAESQSGGAGSIVSRIYKNGSPYGTERSFATSSGFRDYEEDLFFTFGDVIQIYTKRAQATNGMPCIRNFTVCTKYGIWL